jgi:hypothetical protein
MPRRAALLALFLAWFAPAAGAQPPGPDLARQRDAMQKLSAWAGTWSGEGWMQRGPERGEFLIHETITSKLDGLALLVEGRGTDKAQPERVVHQALGVLHYDEAAGGYRFHTWTAEGRSAIAGAEPTPDGFKWWLDVPQGSVNYTVQIKDGVWIEIGEFVGEGQPPRKFLEMTLRKKG